ncbi:MAG: cytidine deaminase [Verrucomicrobia bacterium]|nr:cytidine deaminase [Verrucomicrobiota bacterium]
MKKELTIHYTQFSRLTDLGLEDQALLVEAREQQANAYAPYSKFKVGAAVRLENLQIIGGNNQENAAYPSGLCAERVALFASAARFPNVKIEALAIYANSKNGNTVLSPCGACRQVMQEYESIHGTSYKVLLMDQDEKITLFNSSSDLLPFAFKLG